VSSKRATATCSYSSTMRASGRCGALLEAGAALAAGRQVFVVSPDVWTFAHHPRCRVFSTLEAAIEAIMAMQTGARARAA
jgi:hypothetical protein